MQTIKTFIKDHPHMWWGLYLPVYLGGFFLIEHLITDNYWATQTFIDEYIPFCEYFVIPYDSWGFLLLALGLYLIVKDAEGFRRYMWSIMLTFGFATIFCALVPNGQDLRPAVMEHHNFCTWLLQNTYNLDTNTNVLPSVHVLGVLDALYAVHRTPGLRRTGWRTFADIWGVIIICSTLFVKQHAFIDVVAALVVGAIAYVIIYTIIGGRRDRRMAHFRRHMGRHHHLLHTLCQAARLHRCGGGPGGGRHRLCHHLYDHRRAAGSPHGGSGKGGPLWRTYRSLRASAPMR